MSDLVRSIIQEYTNNIVDGSTADGDFYIVTHHTEHMNPLLERLQQHGYTCSHTDVNPNNHDWCITCFTQHDK